MEKQLIRYVGTFFLSVVLLHCTAQRSDTLRGIRDTLQEVQRAANDLRKDFDRESNVTDKTFNGVSTQLTVASYALVFFTIIVTILGVIFSVYVARTANRASQMEKIVRNLYVRTRAVQKAIAKTEDGIRNNIKSIYDQLKQEETDSFIERLAKQPRDINNLCQPLVTRDLSQKNFAELKAIFLRIAGKAEYENEQYGFKLLLFQHFSRESILADDLRGVFFKDLSPLMNSAFENDIIKSTEDTFSTIIKSDTPYLKEIANQFFEGLQNSKYNSDPTVLQTILSTLNSEAKAIAVYRSLIGNEKLFHPKMALGEKIITAYQLHPPDADFAIIRQDIDATATKMAILAIRPYFTPLFQGAQAIVNGNRVTVMIANSGQTATNLDFGVEDPALTIAPPNVHGPVANGTTRNFVINLETPPPDFRNVNVRIQATFTDVQDHRYSQEIICTDGIVTTAEPRFLT